MPLSGLPAKAVTRGYHLLSLPGNRLRVASEWLLDAALPRQAVQFGLVSAAAVPLDTDHAYRPLEAAAPAPSHPGRADELPSLRSARISTEAPQGARK